VCQSVKESNIPNIPKIATTTTIKFQIVDLNKTDAKDAIYDN